MDPNDEYAVVRLYDFFYYKVRSYRTTDSRMYGGTHERRHHGGQ
jgi:hypothetical protein